MGRATETEGRDAAGVAMDAVVNIAIVAVVVIIIVVAAVNADVGIAKAIILTTNAHQQQKQHHKRHNNNTDNISDSKNTSTNDVSSPSRIYKDSLIFDG